MIDRVISVGVMFDWITPALTLLADLCNDGVVFTVPENQIWSALAIEAVLKGKGVKVWGLSIMHGLIVFHVSRKQARYAGHILSSNQIPFRGGK